MGNLHGPPQGSITKTTDLKYVVGHYENLGGGGTDQDYHG